MQKQAEVDDRRGQALSCCFAAMSYLNDKEKQLADEAKGVDKKSEEGGKVAFKLGKVKGHRASLDAAIALIRSV